MNRIFSASFIRHLDLDHTRIDDNKVGIYFGRFIVKNIEKLHAALVQEKPVSVFWNRVFRSCFGPDITEAKAAAKILKPADFVFYTLAHALDGLGEEYYVDLTMGNRNLHLESELFNDENIPITIFKERFPHV